MSRKFPLNPARPERTCWGCDRYCAADAMICGNGTERTQHPIELFGPGWENEGLDPLRPMAEDARGAEFALTSPEPRKEESRDLRRVEEQTARATAGK